MIDRIATFSLEKCGELLGRDWSAEIVPLSLVTLVMLKEFEILNRFDSFGNRVHVKGSRHCDDRIDVSPIVYGDLPCGFAAVSLKGNTVAAYDVIRRTPALRHR